MKTKKELLKEYYNSNRLSQSKLKLLLSGPKAFQEVKEPELFFEEKQHFIIGGAVDCLITQGEKSFRDTYYVSTLENKPTDVVKSIIQEVFYKIYENETSFNMILSDYRSDIIEACNNHNYSTNWKDETRINKICENYGYWIELVNSKGKIILSQEDYTLINKIVLSLITHKATWELFNVVEEHTEIVYQLPIYFTYEDVEMKALLDMVHFNHKYKTVSIYDIKTIGDNVLNFYKSYSRNRYGLQAVCYLEAMKYYLKENNMEDYEILDFCFIVESTNPNYTGNPCIFVMSSSMLFYEMEGYGRSFTKYVLKDNEDYNVQVSKEPYKGFKELISDYKWYMEFGFDIDRKIVGNNNLFIIKQGYIE